MALAPCGGPHTASAFRYAVWFVSRSATGTPPCGLRARDHTENMGGPGGGGGVGWELGTKADYYPRVVIQHTPGSRLLFSPSLNFARHASVVPSFERRSRKRSDKNGISMSRRGGHRPRGATRGRFCLMTSPIWPLCHITPDQKKPRTPGMFRVWLCATASKQRSRQSRRHRRARGWPSTERKNTEVRRSASRAFAAYENNAACGYRAAGHMRGFFCLLAVAVAYFAYIGPSFRIGGGRGELTVI